MLTPPVDTAAPDTWSAQVDSDPALLRAQRDLRRLHRVMDTRVTVVRALRDMVGRKHLRRPLRVLELGAGDGTHMLGVARSLPLAWRPVELTLLDRSLKVSDATNEAYAQNGWNVTGCTADVLEWASGAGDVPASGSLSGRWDLIVGTLFLHAFGALERSALLGAAAVHGDRFFVCEPRRAWRCEAQPESSLSLDTLALAREDCLPSKRTGFRGSELAALWPATLQPWVVLDYPVGELSHCFRAERLPPTR